MFSVDTVHGQAVLRCAQAPRLAGAHWRPLYRADATRPFEDEGWQQVAIGKFWERFGTRFHSIAWYTEAREDVEEIFPSSVADRVARSGAGVTGRRPRRRPAPFSPTPGTPIRSSSSWHQPLSRGVEDPRFGDTFDPGWWTREHPLHVRKSSHVTIAVRDLEKAKHVFVDVLAGQFLYEGDQDLMATQSAFVALGQDLVIELAQPLEAGSAIAVDMEKNR